MQTIPSTEHAPLITLAERGPVALMQGDEELAYVLSRRDYDRLRRDNITQFQTVCDALGENAVAQGMTETLLAQLLSDES